LFSSSISIGYVPIFILCHFLFWLNFRLRIKFMVIDRLYYIRDFYLVLLIKINHHWVIIIIQSKMILLKEKNLVEKRNRKVMPENLSVDRYVYEIIGCNVVLFHWALC
jgi:hypothetical protein